MTRDQKSKQGERVQRRLLKKVRSPGKGGCESDWRKGDVKTITVKVGATKRKLKVHPSLGFAEEGKGPVQAREGETRHSHTWGVGQRNKRTG